MNRRITLAARPTGVPAPASFVLREEPVRALAPGEVLLENLLLAIDPAIRGMLDDRESYMPPVPIGGVIPGMVLGRVVRSRHPDFAEGDYGRGFAGWETHSILDPANIALERVRIDPTLPTTAYMGALGWSGITAYLGLRRIGAMATGETIAISAAAGAVGSVAGQVARLTGNRVIGIVGGPDKAALVAGLGMEPIDYKAERDLAAAVRAAAPEGVNLYFDNVGGAVLDAMLTTMADFGRIVVCGMIANYNDADNQYPIRNLWQLLVRRITMTGFLAFEHRDMLAEAEEQLGDWLRSGALQAVNNVTDGLENAPAAFIRLMSGETTGKTLVRP